MLNLTHQQAAATVKTIKWHREFIKSHCDAAHIPGDDFNRVMTKEEAQDWLSKAVDNAINARAGYVPMVSRDDYELRRDCYTIRDHATKRIAVHQLMTRICKKRFGHIISNYSD